MRVLVQLSNVAIDEMPGDPPLLGSCTQMLPEVVHYEFSATRFVKPDSSQTRPV